VNKRRVVSLILCLGLCAVAVAALLLIVGRPARAAGPWYVAPGGDDGNDCQSPGAACATIDGALAKPGFVISDTILAATGTYTGTDSEVVLLDKDVTLSGGWDETFATQSGISTIDGEGARRGMTVNGGVTAMVRRFSVQNGLYDYRGGGIENLGTLTLDDCTVSGNSSPVVPLIGSSGGGIDNRGMLTLNNSTVSGNDAWGGGGIFSTGFLTLNSSTVSGNAASRGGGISSDGGTMILRNTILAGNTAGQGPDCYGSTGSSGYNLVGNSSDCTFVSTTGDLTDMDASLGPLEGSPGCHPLLPGSPAVHAGNPAGCMGSTGLLATDQRGLPRFGRCDIGAYEMQPVGLTTKSVSDRDVGPGMPLSYTIALTNGADADIVDVRVTDSVPISLTYLEGTLTATSGSYGYDAGVVTWTGSLSAGEAVSIMYGAQVSQTAPNSASISNSAVISGGGETVTRTATFRVGYRYWTYLPLVIVRDRIPRSSYVAPSGTDEGNCANPHFPCRTVQYAVDQAGSDDVIKVATGLYTDVHGRPAPPGYESPPAGGVISQVVYISKTVTVRGGYTAPGFAEPPDPEANPTTLDAQGQGRGLLISGGMTPTIEGLRITGGDATGLGGGYNDAGGGVYILGAAPFMSNNRIISNTAGTASWGSGGGLYLDHSAATLSDNTVQGNVANTAGSGSGGGLRLEASDATLTGNTILSNTASTGGNGSGGGLFLSMGGATLIGNTVLGNTASIAGEGKGGGLLCQAVKGATLAGNRVLSNTTTLSPTATGLGGGLYAFTSHGVNMSNNIVAHNQANSEGSGLWFSNHFDPALGEFLHNTIADNRGGGQGVWVGYADLVMTNTIIAGHDSVGITVHSGNVTMEATLWYGNGTDTSGAGTIITGAVNIYGDPAFVDPDAGDYHLGAGSAAIDAGVDAGVSEDMDGEPRPMGPGYDIGADEAGVLVARRFAPKPVWSGAPLAHTLPVTDVADFGRHATIADILPDHATTSEPLEWTPLISASGGVWERTLVVTVEEGYAGPLVNRVEVTTTEGASGMASVTVNAGWTIYLPLILRNAP
jgi:uncharacterized repeat protein (TIGR01451 family)